MKAIFVTEYAYAHSNSTGLFVQQICGIAREEVESVLVVSCDQPPKGTSVAASRVWIPFEVLLKKVRLIYWLLASAVLAVKASRESAPGDILVVGTNPMFLPLVMKMLSFLFPNRRRVLLVFDVFPLNFLAVSKGKLVGYAGIILKDIFKNSYLSFDKIVVNGRDCIDIMRDWLNVDLDTIVYSPHFLSSEHQTHVDRHDTVKKSIDLQYFGNTGPMQAFPRCLSTVSRLLDEMPDLTLQVPAEVMHDLEIDVSSRIDSDRVNLFDATAFSARHDVLAGADYGIVTLAAGMYGLAVPSKAWFALASGQAIIVIGDKGCELDRILSRYDALGVFLDAKNLGDAHLKIAGFIGSDRNQIAIRKQHTEDFLRHSEGKARDAYLRIFRET